MNASKKRIIRLTKCEVQSNYNRQKAAEGLILQLPNTHEGRNTWLLNYGVRKEAIKLRERRNIGFDDGTESAHTTDSKIAIMPI